MVAWFYIFDQEFAEYVACKDKRNGEKKGIFAKSPRR